ncbi:MAG: hypothetical protein KF833_12090 [Verrucomicrobiae bacterium]|nr:hypothetical protein [Verrucomicrobiae bacterium]
MAVSLDGSIRLWALHEPAGRAELAETHACGDNARYALVRLPAIGPALANLLSGTIEWLLPVETFVEADRHAFAPTTQRLVLYRPADGTVTVFDPEPATNPAPHDPYPRLRKTASWQGPPRSRTISLDTLGTVIFLSDPGGTHVHRYETTSGDLLGVVPIPDTAVRHMAFASDGRRLLTVSDDGAGRMWCMDTAQPLVETPRHDDLAVFGTFDPDGTRLVTTGYDGTARVCDARTGQPLALPLRHRGTVVGAVFAPSGPHLATLDSGHSVRVWNLESGQVVSPPLPHPAGVRYIAFLGESGALLLTVTEDLRAWLWELPSGLPWTLAGSPIDFDPPNPTDAGHLPSPNALAALWQRRLAYDPRSPDELERSALLLTGHRIEGEGSLVPADLRDLQAAWEAASETFQTRPFPTRR